jgi:hypothetical protein
VIEKMFVAVLALAITSVGIHGVRAAESASSALAGNPLIGGWKADHYYLKDGSSYTEGALAGPSGPQVAAINTPRTIGMTLTAKF